MSILKFHKVQKVHLKFYFKGDTHKIKVNVSETLLVQPVGASLPGPRIVEIVMHRLDSELICMAEWEP